VVLEKRQASPTKMSRRCKRVRLRSFMTVADDDTCDRMAGEHRSDEALDI
jgi:hypothetical protein